MAESPSAADSDQLLVSINRHDSLIRDMMDRLSKQEETGRRLIAENRDLKVEILHLHGALGLALQHSQNVDQGPDSVPKPSEAPSSF